MYRPQLNTSSSFLCLSCNPKEGYSSSLRCHSNSSFALVTTRRESGHSTPATGWLKRLPNDSSSNEAGHTVPAVGWSKAVPNDSNRRESGHTTSAIGWLKLFPNDSC
ncbi:unnamed protein product [Ectocarpus sp. 6 AP-2014]